MVTGERVTTAAGGFNPTFQRHVAAYRLCAPLLPVGNPPTRVLDLGCGAGHSFSELAPRESVGVDLDAAALAGQPRETVAADMRALPFAGGSFASVLAVQSIEHVGDPERVVAEARRVLEPGGTAVWVTPNRLTFGRPDEIIDPYHWVEYDAAQLYALLAPAFASVELRGIAGSPRYADFDRAEKERMERVLRLDAFGLRRRLPRRARQRAYDAALTAARRRTSAAGAAITPEDFRLVTDGLDGVLDLVAVCRA